MRRLAWSCTGDIAWLKVRQTALETGAHPAYTGGKDCEWHASQAIPGQPSAKEILQARYARSEITREQYQQMLGDLN
jgi:hypothetical protein